MKRRILTVLLVLCLLAGCTAAPPKSIDPMTLLTDEGIFTLAPLSWGDDPDKVQNVLGRFTWCSENTLKPNDSAALASLPAVHCGYRDAEISVGGIPSALQVVFLSGSLTELQLNLSIADAAKLSKLEKALITRYGEPDMRTELPAGGYSLRWDSKADESKLFFTLSEKDGKVHQAILAVNDGITR